VLDSLSRLMPNVCSPEHIAKAEALRMLISAYNRAEDLIRIGAYQKGTDPVLDQAIAALPEINRFLKQGLDDRTSLPETVQQLFALPS